MPEIEVATQERLRVDEVVRLVTNFGIASLSVNGRMVLAVELLRLLKPELDELKRRARENTQ